ncbi:RagB/SusD family nutrient uptake outer membrane protein [Capnocytophaga catalasegens]|uniref:Membrane protein n=1 Tax=Capnocytophaga catalasegens TaxID=1004260 RepID=A0AAV5API4_9FLAO|nr:RagB/SusD family nutrient uptake outer membrane protein [Capnocytophaga catalasegens]GIZ16337.1 membrane protein [Capnocytophaga catalasegens]GJM49137.1 membrane protein [Capnocytophaga catalasegens]GJM53679.1 membrane protein [Capnocytophaga catalasegens]
MKKLYQFLLIGGVITLSSCDKFLDIEPKGMVVPSTTEDFRQLLNSGYNIFPKYKSNVAFRSDELTANTNDDNFPVFQNIYIWEDVITTTQTLQYPYEDFYKSIFYANETINSGQSRMPDSPEKNQLIAEAYALRAYNYFSLISMYARSYNKLTAATDSGVPINLIVDLEQDFPKASVQATYDQILSDIQKAESLMQQNTWEVGLNYRFARANLYALAARVYLHMGEYTSSVSYANKALSINNSLVDLNNSQTQPSAYNSVESLLALENTFTLQLQKASFVSDELIAMYDTTNDLRFATYMTSDSGKYKVSKAGNDSFKCSFRTAELYLNKAESEARLGNESSAKNTLLILLKNRYSTTHYATIEQHINTLSGNDLINEILNERMRELAFEGHRWFDLRRTNQKQINHTLNGQTHTLQANDPRYTIPFPKEAIQNNKNL